MAENKGAMTADKPTCEICEVHCCVESECEFVKDKKCTIYENRPLRCSTFPLFFHPYKERVEALLSCPRHLEFQEMADNDPALCKVVIEMHYEAFESYDSQG